MAKRDIYAGQTSNIWHIKARNSSTGQGLPGLTPATSALLCYYIRSDTIVAVPVTLSTITTLGTFSSGGFREVGGSGGTMSGVYQFHPPNAALAVGAQSVNFCLTSTATALGDVDIEVELTKIDFQSSAWPSFNLSANTIVQGIVGSGPSSTSIPTNLTSGGTGFFNGRVVIFTSGALANQATSITGTTSGASCTLTVNALTSAPAQNDTFVIV